MSNETTQYIPADVRDRIIRASILPFEDEETMIAGLRAGAEAVERGELDVDDFVGVWSQYLRELFRRASSVPAPADVRELAVEIIRSLDLIARNYDSYEYGLPVMTHYNEMVDAVVALLRTPRGEGEAEALAWRIEYRGKTSNGWHYQSTCDSLKEAEEKVMRLRRGGVPLEYRIVPLYPAARRAMVTEDAHRSSAGA